MSANLLAQAFRPEIQMIRKAITWNRTILVAIMSLAGFLSMYDVWKEGYGNQYYAAAVKSMLTSFHNFFFASFDGGGFVSVDKPPLGLWVQTFSATVFGFQGWSLILPQALATVISTVLVYHLVRRSFGAPAGVIAALAFALTPILVAVSRTNNFDAVVVMVVLLAAWAVMVAAERGSLKLLSLSMALVGLGFNIKMLQAWMVLPAICLLYLLSPALDMRKKIGHLSVAAIILLIVSLSWAGVVDMTPVDQRPYVGSSQTNSVIDLALGYNGIQRVVPGGSPMGAGVPSGHINISPPGEPGTSGLPGSSYLSYDGADMSDGIAAPVPPGNMPGGMGGFGGEGGTAGLFRLFNEQMAGQISWLLPLAILGFFAAIVTLRKSKEEDSRHKMHQTLFWGAWILPMLVYFSVAGFFHRYYLVMLAPAIAALCAIGLIEMWKAYKGNGWQSLLLPLSLLITALAQAYIIFSYPEWRTWLILAICPVSITAAVILIFAKYDTTGIFRGAVRPLIVCMCAVLLIAPALWSLTPLIYHTESMIPYAGPELDRTLIRANINFSMPGSGMPPMGSFMEGASNDGLTDFLLDHWNNETYLVAVPNANVAAGIILDTGKPVMAVGGFLGSDPILTVDRLEKMVEDGDVRYFMTSGGPDNSISSNNSTGDGFSPAMTTGGFPGGSQSEIDAWVKEHGTLIQASEWGSGAEGNADGMGRAGGFGIGQLYDLKGGR